MAETTLFAPGRMLRRDVELAALDARLDEVVEGHGGVAVVTGPSGIGKTALLAAVRDRARARGLTAEPTPGHPCATAWTSRTEPAPTRWPKPHGPNWWPPVLGHAGRQSPASKH